MIGFMPMHKNLIFSNKNNVLGTFEYSERIDAYNLLTTGGNLKFR